MTRKFIKNILELKVRTEWRFTSLIQKTEPNLEKEEHDWSTLWQNIKGQSGIKCTSMKKNRKLATLIKCINEKLPVLKTLVQRRPDLYKNAICILCNKDYEEDQDHLATCKEYEKE